jgi:hypothetical protein
MNHRWADLHRLGDLGAVDEVDGWRCSETLVVLKPRKVELVQGCGAERKDHESDGDDLEALRPSGAVDGAEARS